MTRALRRTGTALLLALGLLLTGACNSDQTGDSVTDSQVDEVPGDSDDDSEDSGAESPAP
jgi:major membrane immunogen (membrane-anchored lipoprotein)